MIRFLRYFGAESMGDLSKFDLFLDCFGESAIRPRNDEFFLRFKRLRGSIFE